MVQNIRFVIVKVKLLDLHLDAKSYVEGLDIVLNIVID
jgi:hypothetical protein